jgi:bacteriorhodopsin
MLEPLMGTLKTVTSDVPNPSETWLWIGCGAQALGLLIVVALAQRLRPEDKSHAVKAVFVNLLAACSYFAMASGQLDLRVTGTGANAGESHIFQIPRYVDWVFTTPLLLLSLAVIALPTVHHFARQRERTALIGGLMGTQVFLIVTGIFATFYEDDGPQWTWFIISSVAQLVIYWLLFGQILPRAREHGGKNVQLYLRMAAFLTLWWLLYPVAWALGPQGLDLWGETGDAAIFTVLDIVAKVVFNAVLISSIIKLSREVPHVTGISTIELLAGEDPTERALDAHPGEEHRQVKSSNFSGPDHEPHAGNGHRETRERESAGAVAPSSQGRR